MPRNWRNNERSLTPDEKLLWRLVTRDDVIYDLEEASEATALPVAQRLLDVDGYAADQAAKSTPVGVSLVGAERPLICGQYHGVDSASARRMQRGQMPVDMILDLHGSTQVEAYERLVNCVHRCRERKYRLLLVITGKGNRGAGVLRQLLPQWLNDAALRPYVLACDMAGPRGAAAGAYYILLRRKGAA